MFLNNVSSSDEYKSILEDNMYELGVFVNIIESTNLILEKESKEGTATDVEIAKAKALVAKLDDKKIGNGEKKQVIKRRSILVLLSYASGKLMKYLNKQMADAALQSTGKSTADLMLQRFLVSLLVGIVFTKIKSNFIKKDDGEKTIDIALAVKYRFELKRILAKMDKSTPDYKTINNRLESIEKMIKDNKAASSKDKTLNESFNIDGNEISANRLLVMFEEYIEFGVLIEGITKVDRRYKDVEKAVNRKMKALKVRQKAGGMTRKAFNLRSIMLILKGVKQVGSFMGVNSSTGNVNKLIDKTIKVADKPLFSKLAGLLKYDLFKMDNISSQSIELDGNAMKRNESISSYNSKEVDMIIRELTELGILVDKYYKSASTKEDKDFLKEVQENIKANIHNGKQYIAALRKKGMLE